MFLLLIFCLLLSSTVDAAWDVSNETYNAVQRTRFDLKTYAKMANTSLLTREIGWQKDLPLIHNGCADDVDTATLQHAIKVATKHENGTLLHFFEATNTKDHSMFAIAYAVLMMVVAIGGIVATIVLMFPDKMKALLRKKDTEKAGTASEVPASSIATTPKGGATPSQKSEKVTSQKATERASAKGDGVTSEAPKKDTQRDERIKKYYKESGKEIVSDITYADNNYVYFDYIDQKITKKYYGYKRCLCAYASLVLLFAILLLSATIHIYQNHLELREKTNTIVNTQITQLKRDMLYGLRSPAIFDHEINTTVTELVKKAAVDGNAEAAKILNNIQTKLTDVDTYTNTLSTVTDGTETLSILLFDIKEEFVKIKLAIDQTKQTEMEHFNTFDTFEKEFTQAKATVDSISNGKLSFDSIQNTDTLTYMTTIIDQNMFNISSTNQLHADTKILSDVIIANANSFDYYQSHATAMVSNVETKIIYFLFIAGFPISIISVLLVTCCCNEKCKSIPKMFFGISIFCCLIGGVISLVGTLALSTDYQGGCNYLLNRKETLLNASINIFNFTDFKSKDVIQTCNLNASYAHIFSKSFEKLLNKELIALENGIDFYVNNIAVKSDILTKIQGIIQDAEKYHSIFNNAFQMKTKCAAEDGRDETYQFTCTDKASFTKSNHLGTYTEDIMVQNKAMQAALKAAGVASPQPYQDLIDTLEAAKSTLNIQNATRTRLTSELDIHRKNLKTIFTKAYSFKCGLTTIYENMVNAVCDPLIYSANTMEYILYAVTITYFLVAGAFLIAGSHADKPPRIHHEVIKADDPKVLNRADVASVVEQSNTPAQTTPSKNG